MLYLLLKYVWKFGDNMNQLINMKYHDRSTEPNDPIEI